MSGKPNIFVFAPNGEPPDLLTGLEQAGFSLSFGDKSWSLPRGDHEHEMIAQARDAVALMGTSLRHSPITRRVMEASQRLRIVAKYTVGVDDVDTEAATELGILVTHAPTESNCFGVAETTMALLLGITKKVRERDAAVRAGAWRTPDLLTDHLGGRTSDGHPPMTIGFVGFGRIATRVTQLLAPWRVRMIASDPYIPPDRFLLAGVERVDYETLLRVADVVSFHVTLTRETRHMLSDTQILLMKPGAIVINTARGKVLDEAAVARALAQGRLRAAAIDAFEEEPLPDDSPLRGLAADKTLFSPHAASFSVGGGLGPGMAWAARSVRAALAGEIPDNVYNRDVIPRWRERFGGASVTG